MSSGRELGDPAAFARFVAEAEPRLRSALVAAYGGEHGREAVAEALAYAWEHWERVSAMEHPIPYLYRVGQSRTRRLRREVRLEPVTSTHRDPAVEPGLVDSLQRLPKRQRVVVVLVHGYGWTLAEVAALLRVRKSTVQSHLERALERLRRDLHAAGPDARSEALARDHRGGG